MKWNNADEFFQYVNGKSMWGGQCVQLFNGFMGEMYNDTQIYCTEDGYADDIWEQRKTNGVLNYFDEVAIDQMVDGDWVIYGKCNFAPVSHIGMFRKDNGDGTFICLQQNDARHPESTGQDNNPYDGIIGALRLKDWHKPSFRYTGHIQDIGWLDWISNGVCGTTGEAKRMEAIKIDALFEVEAMAHIQDIGWVDYGKINKDTVIGTTGQSKRLECLRLKGNFKYRVHIENTGWTAWTLADGVSTMGTVGQSLRMEAIEISFL